MFTFVFIAFNIPKLNRARSAQNFLTFFNCRVIHFCDGVRFRVCICLYIF